jgi:hypothetical protein
MKFDRRGAEEMDKLSRMHLAFIFGLEYWARRTVLIKAGLGLQIAKWKSGLVAELPLVNYTFDRT